MGPISAKTAIDAPRERVFDTLIDLSLRPAFCNHFVEQFHLARIPAKGQGAAARFRVSPPLGRTWMGTEITELEPPHLISERGRCGRSNRIPAFTAWELLEGASGVTTVQLTFWTAPANHRDRLRELVGAGRWYRRKWKLALRRLKQMVEEGGPVEHVGVGGADRIPAAAGGE
ncbi:MAG: SRPBCC family protein [Solirubrobacterales bacterium]